MQTRSHAGRRFIASAVGAALALGLILAGTNASWASGGLNGTIHGSVLDQDTKAPISDVNVSATSLSGNYKTTTDSHGYYSLIGIPSDTYTLTFSKPGYTTVVRSGLTVIGDQSQDVGAQYMSSAKTIGHVLVTGRANSAYQPKQTQDVTTISGARITQALGNGESTNETALTLAAPGAVQDANGNITIRGSLMVEISNQFDGVPFDAPFFDENGSNGYLNNIQGGAGGSLQLVSGAGDATQGNVGAGIINIVPGRGTYPSSGELDLEADSPYYDHKMNFNYGFASPDTRFSNYFAVSTSRYVPTYAPFGVDASAIGQFDGTSYGEHDDILDNFYYKFGQNQHESFQVLARFADLQTLGNYGGTQLAQWYPNSTIMNEEWGGLLPGCGATVVNCLQQVETIFPGVPTGANAQVTQPEITAYDPMHFLKLGFSDTLNSTTYLNAYFYNWGLIDGSTSFTTGSATPGYVQIGGPTVGEHAELTHQFGEHNLTTLALDDKNLFPVWDQQDAGTMFFNLGDLSPFLYGGSIGGRPTIADWYTPANVGQPVSGTNPCEGPLLGPTGFNITVNSPTDYRGCYIYDYMLAHGLWKGVMPKVPTMGIGYHHSSFQQLGAGLRDQWTASDKLKFDIGVRVDTDNMKFGANPFALSPYSDPSDVNPITQIGSAFLKPEFWEPRFAANYQLSSNDALTASYGRSVEFFYAQTAGTPASANLAYWNPIFAQMPGKDNPTSNPSTGSNNTGTNGPQCGSGWHGPGTGYTQNPNNYYALGGAGGYFFQCQNYASELFWTWDQMDDAPDLGGQGPPTYNDYDLTWDHNFSKGFVSGWGMKITGYARRGYNVEQNILLLNGPPNPVTGQSSASVFATRANGIEKVAGIEAELTTPPVRYGLSGFVSFNFTNELLNTPPVAGSDNLPIMGQQLLQSGLVFHSGFTPPIAGVVGATYTFRDGLAISPVVQYNDGYPFGVGDTSIGYVNGVLYTIPSSNFGIGSPFAGPTGPGNPYNASYYVDPANPGDYFNPNIAATRGYTEPALAGNALTKPSAVLDLTATVPMAHNITIGTTVFNVFNNHNGVPSVNQAYQAVADGVAGPQTGEYAGDYPGSGNYNAGSRNEFGPAGADLPFMPGYNAGTIYDVFLQTKF